jgi:hypothetical protein
MTARTDIATTAPLARYLAAIAGALRGPRGHRERILAELRDGLDQSVAAAIGRGLSKEEAVTAAIADFGRPDVVAAGFAAELAIATARRRLVGYLVTGPLVGVWWLLVLRPDPWHAGLVALVAAIPVLPLIVVAIATAGGTVATTGRLMRWLPEASARQAMAGSATVAALALLGDAVLISLYVRSGLPMQPVGIVAVVASATRSVCSGILLVRLAPSGGRTGIGRVM